jgi:hypothetical protein
MIIFFEGGRLGNQLFQYCAIRKYQPKGKFVAIGMRDLRDNFSGINIEGGSLTGKIARTILHLLGKDYVELMASRLRLMSIVEERKEPEGIGYRVKRGLFGNVLYFKSGYYQAEHIIDKPIADEIELKDVHKKSAIKFLESQKLDRRSLYFVHVRRGDYVTWPNREHPAVLPLSWYRAQMQCIRESNVNARFLVVSDDKPYVEEFFSEDKDVVIAGGDLVFDFALMTQCMGGGIMSASSFSWWASYFIRRERPNALFLAPTYWAGFRAGKWFPESIRTSWITYKEFI